jgi:hypothetical protein
VMTEYSRSPYSSIEYTGAIKRESKNVKICCIVDGFMALFNFSMFLNPVYALMFLASVWGYYSAKYYIRDMVSNFLIYEYVYTISQVCLLNYIIMYRITLDYREWFILTTLPFLQIYITYRVQKLYSYLKYT